MVTARLPDSSTQSRSRLGYTKCVSKDDNQEDIQGDSSRWIIYLLRVLYLNDNIWVEQLYFLRIQASIDGLHKGIQYHLDNDHLDRIRQFHSIHYFRRLYRY